MKLCFECCQVSFFIQKIIIRGLNNRLKMLCPRILDTRINKE